MKYADVRLKYRLDETFFAVTQFYSTLLSDPKLVFGDAETPQIL